MRKRIRQIARDKFEYDQPCISLPEEELSIQVLEGQTYEGSFSVASTNRIPVRGIVYTTNPRMECLTTQFEGEEIRIRYQFHSKGLVEGEVEKGDFVLVCEQRVYILSFRVSVSRLYIEATNGFIRSLSDFSSLAQTNWNEAYQLFYHHDFSNIFSQKEQKEAMMYRGIMAAKPSQQNMEEFLIGIHKKSRVCFNVASDDVSLEMTETLQQEVEIKKSEWGYISIDIETDGAFIRLSDNRITTEDFLGSSYTFKYLIDYDRMHMGYNFGRIKFASAYETKIIEITAHKRTRTGKNEVRSQVKEYKVGIMELYQSYRLKRIVTGVWANETIDILNHLHAIDGQEPMYMLMKAQALIINRQRQEAEWILDSFKRTWKDEKSPVFGYYLYLLTLMEREPSYVDRMTNEIELIFRDYPESSLLFWILLFLKEDYYNNSFHKLKAIENWVMNGCTSPYLYLEAYYLMLQEPYLLTKLGKFEIRILRWAIRNQVLSKELATQIFDIIELNKGFHKAEYQLLCAAYEVEKKPEYLGLICSYLIRAQRFDVRYHTWFEMGIEEKLRITGLYEAYLLSLDDRAIRAVPKIIQMYFQYDSNLSYRKMAILYNNIIASKKTDPEMYGKYQKTMGRFAMEQAELGHMDDNLAVLYEEMLDLGLIDEELSHCMSRILFTHKLNVFDARIVRVIIYQKQLKEPQIVPVTDQTAYFQLYTNDYVMLFEDEKGHRYISSIAYRIENLINLDKYLERCRKLAVNELPYILAYLDKKKSLSFTKEDEEFFPVLLFSNDLDKSYQAGIAQAIMNYAENVKEYPKNDLHRYLQEADYETMSQPVRQYMMESLVVYQYFDLAYDLVQTFGMDQMTPATGLTLVSVMLERHKEDNDADEPLLRFVAYVFLNKKYNDAVLTYLCRFYHGPTEQMQRLWRAAQEFGIQTFELEERILVQMMYAGEEFSEDELFLHYYKTGGRELVVLAYITLRARAYFVKDEKITGNIMGIIRERYQHHMDLNDACKLALLKALSTELKVNDNIYKMEDALLSEYTSRGMNFAFFKKLDKHLVYKYHLYDKVFLEHCADPRTHVVLNYSRDEDGENFIREDMVNVYAGIFVKTFVLFFGDVVQYYIAEELDGQVAVTESNRISNNDVLAKNDTSRFHLINQMLISATLQDYNSEFVSMKQYAEYEETTKTLFKLL